MINWCTAPGLRTSHNNDPLLIQKNAIKISFFGRSFVFFFRDALQAEKYFFNLAEHQTGLFVLDIWLSSKNNN